MRSVTGVGRVAAVGAVVAAVVLVALVMFGAVGGTGYTIKAEFLSGAQLVKGNEVQIGGTKVGTVKQIDVTPQGNALITMQIQKKFAPLRRGTKAVIRQASLSGIANRLVDLQMPSARSTPAGATQEEIPDGGTIGVDETTTAVDLDEVFNIFDPPTRYALQEFFKGSRRQWVNMGEEANKGLQYLDPSLSASRRLFNELNADTPLLERFIVDSAQFMTAVAERRDDLVGLVSNLNATMRALGSQQTALAQAIHNLPELMRSANTTFVNLRFTVQEGSQVEELVDESKPVARKLRRFLPELRAFINDAEPTVKDLDRIVKHPGRHNDLLDLNRTFPPLASTALDTKRRTIDFKAGRQDVGETRGAFPENTQALKDAAPIIAFGRPYTPDLMGWFDDFSNTGTYDALGGISRLHNFFTFLSVSNPALPPLIDFPAGLLPPPFDTGFSGLGLRSEIFRQEARFGQFKRCPGAAEDPAEDGSNVWSAAEQEEFDCLEEDRATGDE